MNDNQKLRAKKILRIVLKVLAWITATLTVIIISLSLFIYFSKDKIKSFVVDEINKHLLTEISVKEIDVSLFRNFPYVSLVFEDIVIPEVIHELPGEDTLIAARWVSLQFNVWDVIVGKYRLRRVNIEESKCHLKILQDGTPNYYFWKTDTTDTADSDFELLLRRVRCDQLEFYYENFYSDVHMKLMAEEFTMAGRFDETKFDMTFSGQLHSEFFSSGKYRFLTGIPVECSGEMNADIDNQLYTFTDALLILGNVSVYIDGTYTDTETPQIDIVARNEQCQLRDFMSLLPDNVQKDLELFEQSGNVAINAVIKGPFSKQQLPAIAFSILLSNGKIHRQDQNITLEDLSFNIDYSCNNLKKPETAVLTCRSFSATLGSGTISGKFELNGFGASKIKAELLADLDLQDVQKFINYEDIVSMTGRINAEIVFSGEFADINNIRASDFTNSKSTGLLKSESMEVIMRNFGEPIQIRNLKGTFSEKDLILDGFYVSTCGSDISVSGVASNIFPFFMFQDEKLQISGKGTSGILHVNRIFAANSSTNETTTSEDTKYWVSFSKNLSLDLQLNVGEVIYNSFHCNNVKTTLLLNNQVLLLRDMSFSSMDGTAEAEVIIDTRPENTIDFRIMANLNNINITKAFTDFNNFGQTSLTDKHLKGNLSGTVHFSSKWSKSLEIDMSSVTVVANIQILDGAILNYEPLAGLEKYFRRRDFSNVEFASLTNEIVIQDQKILIPEMRIQSNVMDFEMQGTHDFKNNINYNFEIQFSELINKPTGNKPRAEDEYGTIEEDREDQLTWHFKVTGTVDNPKFVPLDIRSITSKSKDDLKKESNEAKNLLKQEFGSKKDSTEQIIEHNNGETPRIIIEWEDE
jgi:hypothetical protein